MATICIKRYTIEDIDKIIHYAKEFVSNDRGKSDYECHFKNVDIDEEKVYNIFINRINDVDFFCNLIFYDQEIVGGLCADVAQPFFSSKRIAYDNFLYVTPTFVNVRAVTRLIQTYIDWAAQRDVVECRLCSSTGFNQKAFTKLCQLKGFKQFEIGFAKGF